ncbi:MAG: type B 50S ribosomal protein L31 [Myxococcota bacterium]
MQKGIHPDYRFVVFRDITNDFQFITRSTIAAKNTCEVDGVEYPLINVDISSQSHPFYTGTQKIMDTAGRVEKYYKKYGFQRPEDPDEVAAKEAAAEPAAESDN